MTNRDDLLRQVSEANPHPNTRNLSHDMADSRPPLALLVDDEPLIDASPPSGTTWYGPIVAAVAMVVVLAIGGTLWLLRADPSPDGEVSRPDPAAPVTTALATDVEVAEPGSAVPGPWTSHVIPGEGPPSTNSIASVASRFIATGVTFTRGDIWGRGQIWFTVDNGYTWIDVENSGLFEEGHFTLGVAGTDAGGVVWGTNDRQGGTVIWHSYEGSRWSLVTTGDPALDGGQRDSVTDGLALVSGGYVLYGAPPNCIVESDRCVPSDAPRLLLSPDGLSWELVTTPVSFRVIAQIETGDLLAVGGRISEPTTWISHDEGRTWRLHGPDHTIESGPSVEVWALEPTPYGLIAAGVDAAGVPMLWISEHGKTFTPTLELPVAPEEHQYSSVNGIAFGEGWVIAVGQVGRQTADLPNQPAMWASQDGRDWLSVPLEGRYFGGGGLADIAYRDKVFIVVGDHKVSPGNAGESLVLRWDTTGD